MGDGGGGGSAVCGPNRAIRDGGFVSGAVLGGAAPWSVPREGLFECPHEGLYGAPFGALRRGRRGRRESRPCRRWRRGLHRRRHRRGRVASSSRPPLGVNKVMIQFAHAMVAVGAAVRARRLRVLDTFVLGTSTAEKSSMLQMTRQLLNWDTSMTLRTHGRWR